MTPTVHYTISELRRKTTYTVDSQDIFFYEFIVEAIDEPSLEPCDIPIDSYYQIRLVVDLKPAHERRKTFVSDGLRLFTDDLKRCRKIDEAFKDKFRITAFDKMQ